MQNMSGDLGEQQQITISIRVVRSFVHRNIHHRVMRAVSPTKLVKHLKEAIFADLRQDPNIPPTVQNYAYDTLKIEHQPHKAKSHDPVINTADDDQLVLRDDQTLHASNVINETVLSFFKMEDYLEYKLSKVA
ncbi:UPF0538 protein C2orf76 homolog [Ixodes scapularis]|uniref:UPF0538 protein C2orf76 homolog n=1 Tax=Ixodes scapularis TaxID=6945 RepID=UPI001C38DBFB|nr:UPF0538 protein C2orf76 homolog [Ixodes scapularis]